MRERALLPAREVVRQVAVHGISCTMQKGVTMN